MKKLKFEDEAKSFSLRKLDDLEIKDTIEIHKIQQDLPEVEYPPLRMRHGIGLKLYEEITNRKLKITAPKDRYGRRYVLIERIK